MDNSLKDRQGTPCQKIRLFYYDEVRNVGDSLNPLLISGLFGIQAVSSDRERKDHLLAAGSIMSFANDHSHVWGSGVIHPSYPVGDVSPTRIHALRGKLTYGALHEKGIAVRDVPLGDPGFLVSRLFGDAGRDIGYRIGLAAHYVDRSHPWVVSALADPEVADLNVHADPEDFVRLLLACETVVSSSLHGLIFAEAFGVPNVWVKLSEKVIGGGFKFHDWFSLAECPQWQPALPDVGVREITAGARLHDMHVDGDSLIGCFPLHENSIYDCSHPDLGLQAST